MQFQKESTFLHRVIMFSNIRDFWCFHFVLVGQWRQINVQKSVLHVQSCWLFTITKSFQEIRMEGKSETRVFGLIQRKISRSNWTSEKTV